MHLRISRPMARPSGGGTALPTCLQHDYSVAYLQCENKILYSVKTACFFCVKTTFYTVWTVNTACWKQHVFSAKTACLQCENSTYINCAKTAYFNCEKIIFTACFTKWKQHIYLQCKNSIFYSVKSENSIYIYCVKTACLQCKNRIFTV